MRIQSAMPLGQPRPMQADQAFPTLLKPHVAAARRVGLLRAMADILPEEPAGTNLIVLDIPRRVPLVEVYQ